MLRNCFIISLIIILNIVVTNADEDNCPTPISRQRWGGRYPTEIEYHVIPVKNVMIQHTYSPQCFTIANCSKYVQDIQSYHQAELNVSDSLFNFYIGDDGNAYEALGWYHQAPYTKNYSSTTIEIAFIGNFNKIRPSSKALTVAKQLLECAVFDDKLDDDYALFGASQKRDTDSPGRKLYQEIKKWEHYISNPNAI